MNNNPRGIPLRLFHFPLLKIALASLFITLMGAAITADQLPFIASPASADTVVCENGGPAHPSTYWYDVSPSAGY